MSNAIVKNAVIVLGVQQGQVDFKVDLGPILAALEKEKELLKKVKEGHDKAAAAAKAQAEADKKAKEEQIRKTQDLVVAQQRLSDQFKASRLVMIESSQAIGEGLFSMARGFTLLGISGEENLAAIAKKLALVQAGFDIFRGVGTTIKTVIVVQEELAKVSAAVSAATAAEAAAHGTNATAKIASAGASRLLAAAMGPVGLAATIAIGLIAALTLNRNKEAEAVKQNIEALDKERAAFDKSNAARAAADQLRGGSSQQANLDAAKRTVRAIEQQLEATKKLADEQHAIGTDSSRVLSAQAAARERTLELDEKARGLAQERVLALLRVKEAEQAIADGKQRALEATERQAQADQQAAAAKQQQFQREFEAVKRIREQEQARLQAEKDRIASNRQSVGRLDELGRARLDAITKRAQSGKELNQKDLGFLGGLGGGFAEFANKQFQQRGGGADELLGRLGISPSGESGDDALAQIVKSGQDLSEGVEDVFEKVNTVLTATLDRLDGILARVDANETDAAKGRA